MSAYLSVVGHEGRLLLVQLDKFVFAALTGKPGQTISSGLDFARRNVYGWKWKALTAPLRWLVDLVARVVFRQSDHCARAVEPDDR